MKSTALNRFAEELHRLDETGLRRRLPSIGPRDGARLVCGDAELLNLSSNDYLGLGGDAASPASMHGEVG